MRLSRSEREVHWVNRRPRFPFYLFPLQRLLSLNPYPWPQMTGLLKINKTMPGSGSQISLHRVLSPVWNERLWFSSSDQEYSGKIPIKANLPPWRNFGQLSVHFGWTERSAIWIHPNSCAVAKCLAEWSEIRKYRIGRLARKHLGKRYWMSTVYQHICSMLMLSKGRARQRRPSIITWTRWHIL